MRDNDRSAAFQELRNLAELMESNDQLVETLASISLRDLPGRLVSEGFNANQLIELLGNVLKDVIKGHSSGKALDLTDILEMNFSTLDQVYPDLARDVIVAIETMAAQPDNSLLSVAGGTSHSSDWKQNSSKTSTPDSDRHKKVIAEVAVGLGGGAGIGAGLYKLLTKPRDQRFDDIDQKLETAKKNAEKNELKFGEHLEESRENRVNNRSKSLKNPDWSELKYGWGRKEKLTKGDLNDPARNLDPDRIRIAQSIRDKRIDKARRHWKEQFADIADNDKPNTIQFKEDVSVREIAHTIRSDITPSGKPAKYLEAVTNDLPNRSLRPAPSRNLSDLNFDASLSQKISAKEIRRYIQDPKVEIRDRIGTRADGRNPAPPDTNPAQRRGILKRPAMIPNSDLEHLRIAAESIDISELNPRRIELDVKSIDILPANPNHSEPSDRLSQAFRESNLSGSLLENRPELQRNLIQHQSILLNNISDEIEEAKNASGKVVSNAEQEVKNAARIEVKGLDSAIDDVAEDL